MNLQYTRVGTSILPRLMGCFINQRKKALVCPELGRLEGRVIAITGATNGIGMETAKSLVKAGARVLLLVRNETKAQALLETWGTPVNTDIIVVDLSDLRTIETAALGIEQSLDGSMIDTLIENAGVSPKTYAQTAQGYEIAFGTNVLGHFALRKVLMRKRLLGQNARIVTVTGDIYITTRDCTANFTYQTPIGATLAYSRSKLGNIWIARALQKHHPELIVTLVHPGVVDSGLMMGDRAWERLMKKALLPTPLGAQTSLYCATQRVTNGGYYHNTRGLVQLSEKDPGMNEKRALALWQLCESITEPDATHPAERTLNL